MFETTIKSNIIKYSSSCDKIGLLAYLDNGHFYHIHSDELTILEKWIHGLLINAN